MMAEEWSAALKITLNVCNTLKLKMKGRDLSPPPQPTDARVCLNAIFLFTITKTIVTKIGFFRNNQKFNNLPFLTKVNQKPISYIKIYCKYKIKSNFLYVCLQCFQSSWWYCMVTVKVWVVIIGLLSDQISFVALIDLVLYQLL